MNYEEIAVKADIEEEKGNFEKAKELRRLLPMSCPHCGSYDLDIPMVDIGVGSIQCDAASCMVCGAREAWPDDKMDDATEIEKQTRWYKFPF